jgi:flagellar biosynthesis GTPase FlhF
MSRLSLNSSTELDLLQLAMQLDSDEAATDALRRQVRRAHFAATTAEELEEGVQTVLRSWKRKMTRSQAPDSLQPPTKSKAHRVERAEPSAKESKSAKPNKGDGKEVSDTRKEEKKSKKDKKEKKHKKDKKDKKNRDEQARDKKTHRAEGGDEADANATITEEGARDELALPEAAGGGGGGAEASQVEMTADDLAAALASDDE